MKWMFIFAVVVVVIVVIVLLMRKRVAHRVAPSASNKLSVRQTFVVTLGDKTETNRFLNEGDKRCFYIDGMEAPNIILARGMYYEFKNHTEEPLYFTSDLEGGYNDQGEEAPGSVNPGFKGLAGGSIFLFTSDDLPVRFFYQSGKHRLMGSAIQLA